MEIMSAIITKLNEGGPFFTYPMVIILLLILMLFARELLKGNNQSKTISLLSSIGWFVIAWGFLGHTIGLVTAFDNVGAHGEIAPAYLATGLKMALLNLLMGSFVFIVARLCIIILIWKRKES